MDRLAASTNNIVGGFVWENGFMQRMMYVSYSKRGGEQSKSMANGSE